MRIFQTVILALIIMGGSAGSVRCEWQTFDRAYGLEFVYGMVIDSAGGYWFDRFGPSSGLVRYDGNRWRTYTAADGLPVDAATPILVDHSGNLWFAGSGGAIRFDGVSVTTYTTADGLADDHVSSILEDRLHRLWFATPLGVSCYDGTGWRTYTSADGLVSDYVTCMTEDHDGNLWFAGGGAVTRFDGTNWQTHTLGDSLAESHVTAMMADRSGRVWCGIYSGGWEVGVACYDGMAWRMLTTADGLADNWILSILEDRTGCLWFGTGNGISRFDGTGWTTLTEADGLASYFVTQVSEDRVGNLWFVTGAGVSRYDKVDWRVFASVNPPAGATDMPLYVDREGRFWSRATGGMVCYDARSWRAYAAADGLADSLVNNVLEDNTGRIWFGTPSGVSRYDGTSWITFTTTDGLANDTVNIQLETSTGDFWFGTPSGVSRYDGATWATYTKADGLASNSVTAMLEDGSGNLWFATPEGVTRYDGISWTTFTTADGLGSSNACSMVKDGFGHVWVAGGFEEGLSRWDGTAWTSDFQIGPYNDVRTLCVDSRGKLWVGSWKGGVKCFDGLNWTSYLADWYGEGDVTVSAICEDRAGNLWFGTTFYGVARFDGSNWTYYTASHGLAGRYVSGIAEDCAGVMWFGTEGGITLFEPDHVSPITLFLQTPSKPWPLRQVFLGWTVAFGEAEVEFSYSLDEGPWSTWSPINAFDWTDIGDGEHTFRVRSRDRDRNVELIPAHATFEVDATPPAPLIAFPAFGQAVRDSILMRGTAADSRFRHYRVEFRGTEGGSWIPLCESSSPVLESTLCCWNTLSVPDGNYELRLSVTDTLGLTGTALVRVVVDNHAPWAYETAPALVGAATGGHIYTTDGGAHLYFPPRAFARDAEVSIVALGDAHVPDTLGSGARRVFAGYEIAWSGASLEKTATLELSYARAPAPLREGALALYVLGADSTWRRLGGTVDASARRISSSLTGPGCYAVFAEIAGVPGVNTLSGLTLTPRVFSPGGTFGNTQVALGFTLGRSASVDVKVYNRAGRLVRGVLSGQVMGAGANLVYWDGRDGGGAVVPAGMYLVTVETEGHRESKTVSVVK